jgi:hypothetical protein
VTDAWGQLLLAVREYEGWLASHSHCQLPDGRGIVALVRICALRREGRLGLPCNGSMVAILGTHAQICTLLFEQRMQILRGPAASPMRVHPHLGPLLAQQQANLAQLRRGSQGWPDVSGGSGPQGLPGG